MLLKMRGQRRGWCGRFSHPRGLMFFCEGTGLISPGLFSWMWAYAGPPQASPFQSLHMKPLLHIYVIPQQHSPTSTSSPHSFSILLYCFKCKINIELHFGTTFLCISTQFEWSACSSQYLESIKRTGPPKQTPQHAGVI